MFQIGGYVTYRAEGVCVIRDIREECFGGTGMGESYYVLVPLNDERSTIFVPVANEKLVGMMRPLLSSSEIVALTKELGEERLSWLPDSRSRSTMFRDILAGGDPRELIVLANTIRERAECEMERGKRPTGTDLAAKARAEKLLLDEFSATTDLTSVEQITPLLRGELIPEARGT
ncbi:MAG: hypothetical protein IJY47_07390 [Clostridia bacterium]|nr:hypothetical protein [Clostridia bacterium]